MLCGLQGPFSGQTTQVDETESTSLSPRINRNNLHASVREYELEGMSVKRYVIHDLSKQLIGEELDLGTLHPFEVELFRAAYVELKDRPSADEFIGRSPNNVVLVDTFVREDNRIKNDGGKPAVHTICLWKKRHDLFLLIDPTNSTFTENLKEPIEKLLNVSIEISRPRGQKFYASPFACPLIGTSPETFRDCIDIAVKIAFHLNNSQAKEIKPSEAQDGINILSNQAAVNGNVVGRANAIRLRELQSSNETDRERAKQLLKNNAKYLEFLEVQTIADLEELEGYPKSSLDDSLKKHADTLKITKRISLNKLEQLNHLQDKIDALNKDVEEIHGFSSLRITLGQEREITRYIENEEENYTKLHLAVQQGKIDEVRLFLEEHRNNPKLIGAWDRYGQTALHWAAGKGNIDAAKLLIKLMDSKDIAKQTFSQKSTALHFAVHVGSNPIIELIAGRGITDLCGIQDIHGQTALYWAAATGKTEAAQLLINVMTETEITAIRAGENNTALHVAVHCGNNEIVEALTYHKRFPHLYGIQDAHGQTALHWAAGNGNVEAARLLIEAMTEEDIKKQRKEGQTALLRAIHANSLPIVKLLLEKVPSLASINDEYGQSPLSWASGKKEIHEYLSQITVN